MIAMIQEWLKCPSCQHTYIFRTDETGQGLAYEIWQNNMAVHVLVCGINKEWCSNVR